MKNPTTTPLQGFDLAIIVNCVVGAILFATAGVGFVHVKNQQHAVGSLTRETEFQLREIRAYNKVLLTEIDRLSSHAQISSRVANGEVALIPINGPSLARLSQPVLEFDSAHLRTATAATSGEATP
jgi:hypothetical protein